MTLSITTLPLCGVSCFIHYYAKRRDAECHCTERCGANANKPNR